MQLLNLTDDNICELRPDIIKYLYSKYSNARMYEREYERSHSYLLFDDQTNYLPKEYHLVHEEFEEQKLDMLNTIRKDVYLLLVQLQSLFNSVTDFEISSLFWSYFKYDMIEDTTEELVKEYKSTPEPLNEIELIEAQANAEEPKTYFEQQIEASELERVHNERVKTLEDMEENGKTVDETVLTQVLKALSMKEQNQNIDNCEKTEEAIKSEGNLTNKL